jgi:predicted porin
MEIYLMKKSLLALAVLGAFATAAQADSSVTLFGTIDAGIMTQNNAGASLGHQTAFQDGQMAPSVFGLKGKEDLGGGLYAGFELEGGMVSGTGIGGSGNHTSNNGGLFGRQSFIELSGDFGKVKVGEQYDPALYAALWVDPRGLSDSFSTLGAWVSAYVFSNTPNGSGQILNGVFDVNSVSYEYSNSGFTVDALYSFGGVAGSTNAGAIKSIGAWYKGNGWTVSGGFNQTDDANGNKAVQGEVLGVGYATGPWAIRSSWTNFKVNSLLQAEVSNTTIWGIGADYKFGSSTVNLSYFDAKNGDTANDKTSWVAVMDTYKLSKRTSLFAQIADVKADTAASITTTAFSPLYAPTGAAAANTSTFYLGVGIQHSF